MYANYRKKCLTVCTDTCHILLVLFFIFLIKCPQFANFLPVYFEGNFRKPSTDKPPSGFVYSVDSPKENEGKLLLKSK